MSRLLICVSALLGLVWPVHAQAKDDSLPAGVLARLGEVRYRNVGRVFSIAFSPDGKTLLAGAWDGSIRLWDVATRKELRQYAGHKGWVRSVAFAPDGKTFASDGKDKIVRIWETSTAKELRRFEGHQKWIQYLAFSPDGKTLASRSTGLTIRLWDTASARQSRQIDLQPHTPSGHASFAFSPDGSILAGMSGPPQFWDLASGKELRPLTKEGFFRSLVFSPNRHSLATADGDHSIRVWEMATRQVRCRFQSPDKQPYVLAYSPDGRILAQGSEDTSVLLWDVTGLQGKDRPRSASLPAKDLQALWTDLASDDAAVAFQAMRKLATGSKDSVPFIQEHLRPVSPVDARTVERLVADLDSEQFRTREHATKQLEQLGELAEPALRRGLRDQPALEKRQRIDRSSTRRMDAADAAGAA